MNHLLKFTSETAIDIERSQGCYLYDKEGTRYLDMESGVWCTNLGHNHPRIKRIITKQLDLSIHLGYQAKSQMPEKLAFALQKKLRFSASRSVFLSSGSEAVDLALSISRRITGRTIICAMDGSYLGAYGHALNSSENKNIMWIKNNDFQKLSTLDFGKIAAFVFEPGNSWGKISLPSAEFVSAVIKKAKANKCLVVVDEVTTGMGRTGKWFGLEHYRIKPDIVACGKALGNGYPVSSVTLDHSAAEALSKNPFRYAQSHQNDPLGCAIALAVITEIDRSGLVDQSEEKGILFKSLLKDIAIKQRSVKEIRGIGLMLAMVFHEESDAERTHDHLRRNHVVAGLKNDVLRFMPPLVIGHDQIHEVISIIRESFN